MSSFIAFVIGERLSTVGENKNNLCIIVLKSDITWNLDEVDGGWRISRVGRNFIFDSRKTENGNFLNIYFTENGKRKKIAKFTENGRRKKFFSRIPNPIIKVLW
jgi:hypothetical protein